MDVNDKPESRKVAGQEVQAVVMEELLQEIANKAFGLVVFGEGIRRAAVEVEGCFQRDPGAFTDQHVETIKAASAEIDEALKRVQALTRRYSDPQKIWAFVRLGIDGRFVAPGDRPPTLPISNN